MKRKFLKSIALIMCVVITCLTLSVGSVAASGNVYEAIGLEGYVERVITNQSETITLVETIDPSFGGIYEYDNHQFAITKNGKDFKMLDFNKYKPSDSDCIMVYDCAVKEDTFVFVLKSFDISGEYDYIETSTKILSTSDFETYTDCDFEAIQDKTVLRNTYHERNKWSKCGFLGFVGDVLVFADTSYETVGENKFKGVFYTTEDLKNWSKEHTVTFDGIVVDNYDEKYTYVSFAYKEESGYLIVEELENTEWGYSCTNAYITHNFISYQKIYEKEEKLDFVNLHYEISDESYELIILESYMDVDAPADDEFGSGENLSSVNIQTGIKTELIKKKSIETYNGWVLYGHAENVYFVTTSQNDNTEINVIKTDLSVQKTKGDYSISDFYYLTNNKDNVYAISKNCIYHFFNGNMKDFRKYDTSEFGFDSRYSKIFELNERLYYIESKYTDTFSGNVFEPIRIAEIETKSEQLGDLNNDSKVNSSDALLVLQAATGIVNLTQEQKSFADVNKDGKINSNDALRILQFATNLISSLR